MSERLWAPPLQVRLGTRFRPLWTDAVHPQARTVLPTASNTTRRGILRPIGVCLPASQMLPRYMGGPRVNQ